MPQSKFLLIKLIAINIICRLQIKFHHTKRYLYNSRNLPHRLNDILNYPLIYNYFAKTGIESLICPGKYDPLS